MYNILLFSVISLFIYSCTNKNNSSPTVEKVKKTTESMIQNPVSIEKNEIIQDTQRITGFVIDGPIKDATVFIDSNSNGVQDAGETFVKTGQDGNYKIDINEVSDFYIVSLGGINTSTGKPFEGTLSTYIEADTLKIQSDTHITPITTLISAYKKNNKGKSINEIKEKVAETLDLAVDDLDKNPMEHVDVFIKSNLIHQSIEIINHQLTKDTLEKNNNYEKVVSALATSIDRAEIKPTLSELSLEVIDTLEDTNLSKVKDKVKSYISTIESLSIDNTEKIKDYEMVVDNSLSQTKTMIEQGQDIKDALDTLAREYTIKLEKSNEAVSKTHPVKTSTNNQAISTKENKVTAYTITVNLHGNGSTSPNLPSNLPAGQSMVFTIDHDDDVVIDSINNIECSSASIDNKIITIENIASNCLIDVQFKKIITIQTEAIGNGSLTPEELTVIEGDSTTLHINLPTFTEVEVTGCGGHLHHEKYHIPVITDNCNISAIFNTLHIPSQPFVEAKQEINVQGSLLGHIKFAQNHMVTTQDDIDGMHLVGLRPTLLMFQPKEILNEAIPIMVKAYNDETFLGELPLLRPHKLPKPYVIDKDLKDINFDINQENAFVLNTVGDVAIKEALDNHDVVKLTMKNGFFKSQGQLPEGDKYNNKVFILQSKAQMQSYFTYSEKKGTVVTNDTIIFKRVNNEWYSSKDQINTKHNVEVTYGLDFWSAQLPYTWLEPGLKIVLTHENKTAHLASSLTIGSPSEILLHTIDIGMLVEPRNQFDFQKNQELQREYFQTIPVSRLIVSQYAPVYFKTVRLPDNRLFTDLDPSEGGWHSGTMRGLIGKQLISIGINNANYGIHSSIGEGESQNPYFAAQITAHNSRGRYSNGVVIHGGSGGAGMVTLENTIGNEFSHEVGHNFGLGHYVGGFQGTVHKDSSHMNSTWGWDIDTNFFIPNFFESISNKDTCLNSECVQPFFGRQFGKDAMGGGSPTTNSQYTLYSPHSMKKIQAYLENKMMFDQSSPTGFWRWDTDTHQKKFIPLSINLDSKTLGQNNSKESDIEAALAKSSLIHIHYADGNWQRDIHIPTANQSNNNKIISLKTTATYSSNIHINNETLTLNRNKAFTFYSNGSQWINNNDIKLTRDVKPSQFGIPVVTLVGYYDPEQELKTTIYPALFGNYGYTYVDENQESMCKLNVTIKNNESLSFNLLPIRQKANRMNKFHVNVAQKDNPSEASIICNGFTLDTITIPSSPNLPPVNILGAPL